MGLALSKFRPLDYSCYEVNTGLYIFLKNHPTHFENHSLGSLELGKMKKIIKGTVHLFGFFHGKLNSPSAVEWY